MGHSFGGAVSGLVALQDPDKIPAVVLDAPQFDFGLPIYNTQASILYLTGTDLKFGKTKVSNENLNQALVKHYPNIQERNFEGASHMNFTDLNHVTPLKWTGVLGPVDNKVFWQSLNDAVLNFFNQQFENDITNAR
jgi:acetyl esterase/lipase